MPYADPAKNRECQKRYRLAHRDELLARRRATYQADLDKSRAAARQKNARGKKRMAKWHQENKVRRAERIKERARNDAEFRAMRASYMKSYREGLRDKVLRAYGNRCRCCGETGATFLAVDHVYNDGNLERNGSYRSGNSQFYNMIIRSGFPSRYQVLCHSCNMSKHINKGVCAHKSDVWRFMQSGLVKERPYAC
jgi:hypothetical protein